MTNVLHLFVCMRVNMYVVCKYVCCMTSVLHLFVCMRVDMYVVCKYVCCIHLHTDM